MDRLSEVGEPQQQCRHRRTQRVRIFGLGHGFEVIASRERSVDDSQRALRLVVPGALLFQERQHGFRLNRPPQPPHHPFFKNVRAHHHAFLGASDLGKFVELQVILVAAVMQPEPKFDAGVCPAKMHRDPEGFRDLKRSVVRRVMISVEYAPDFRERKEFVRGVRPHEFLVGFFQEGHRGARRRLPDGHARHDGQLIGQSRQVFFLGLPFADDEKALKGIRHKGYSFSTTRERAFFRRRASNRRMIRR